MLKDMSGAELATAIRTVMAGGSLLDAAVVGKVMAVVANMPAASQPQPLAEPLSEREIEILRLVALGWSNGEIGRKLHLAEGTIKNYVSSILHKTNSRDRTQAALTAQQLGYLYWK